MSYVKQTWVNDVTEVDADHMNHIEDGIDQAYNVELLAVVDTAPSECSEGDKYYNTTTNKIYTATGSNTWGSDGEDAVVGIMYVVFDEQATYSYDGITMVSVGGGSDEVAISTTQPTNDEKIWINPSMTTNQAKYKDGNTWTEVTIKALDSMPVGTQVNYTGSDIPVGWQQVNDFSTSEVNTGQKWIDGKPIYRKVINLGLFPNNSYIEVNTNLTNVKIIRYDSYAYTSGLGALIKTDQYQNADNNIRTLVYSNKIRITATGNFSTWEGYIILEYTKTTD